MANLQSRKNEASPADLFAEAERRDVVSDECDGRKLRELS
jgi:hypothetical protein